MPRRRTPTALKVVRALDRPDRHQPEAAFPPAGGMPDAPDWLTGPVAVQEWGRLVGLLQGARVLTEADLTVLGHLCNLHAELVKLWRAGMKPTAAEVTQLRLLATEFGLTPASRSKPKAVPVSDDEAERFFA